MTRRLENELTRIHTRRIRISNSGLDGQLSPHSTKTLQELERREAQILSEIARKKEAA